MEQTLNKDLPIITPKPVSLYQYEKKRDGFTPKAAYGNKYGPYLYKCLSSGRLVASWEPPKYGRKQMYNGDDIGIHSDAIFYT